MHEILHHLSNHETPLFVGIYRGVNRTQGFLGGAISGFRNHPQHEADADFVHPRSALLRVVGTHFKKFTLGTVTPRLGPIELVKREAQRAGLAGGRKGGGAVGVFPPVVGRGFPLSSLVTSMCVCVFM